MSCIPFYPLEWVISEHDGIAICGEYELTKISRNAIHQRLKTMKDLFAKIIVNEHSRNIDQLTILKQNTSMNSNIHNRIHVHMRN